MVATWADALGAGEQIVYLAVKQLVSNHRFSLCVTVVEQMAKANRFEMT